MPASVSGSSFFGRLSSARSSLASKEHKATVQLLDDSETVQCEFKKNDAGQTLLDYVCDYLQVVEKDYFGLRFQDANKHRYWLDTTKQITKQVRAASNLAFRLRIRYYPSDPSVLKEEITRYQLFLQLRRDLLHGRLYCPQNEAAILGAHIIQSELGDFDPSEHKDGYVSEYKLFLKQTSKLEENIARIHQTLSGLSPAEAELEFLKRAAQLDTYGFDPHTVKDAKQGSIYVGVTHQGILVYQANRKVHHIKWSDVDKVDYVGKELRITPKSEYFQDAICSPIDVNDKTHDNGVNGVNGGDKTGEALMNSDGGGTQPTQLRVLSTESPPTGKRGAHQVLKYLCPSATFAKHLWRHILSQQAFFTERRAFEVKPKFSKPRIPLLSRGSTFRYTGRVLHEIEEAEPPNRQKPLDFVRYHLEKQPGRDERQYPWLNKYSTLPRSFGSKNKSATTENGVEQSTESTISREAPAAMSTPGERLSSPTLPITVDTDDGRNTSPVYDFSPSEADTRASNAYEREKVTTFTIHLSRTEPSPQLSPSVSPTKADESSLLANCSDYRSEVLDWSNSDEPLAKSTPLKRTELNGAIEKRLDARTQPPTTTTDSAPGVCRTVLRSLLTALLFAFIFGTIVVAVFEVKDEHFQQYVHAMPGAAHFRHQLYEPSREFVLEQYDLVTAKYRGAG